MAFYSRSWMLSRTAFCAALAASTASLWSVPSTHADDGYYAGSFPLFKLQRRGKPSRPSRRIAM